MKRSLLAYPVNYKFFFFFFKTLKKKTCEMALKLVKCLVTCEIEPRAWTSIQLADLIPSCGLPAYLLMPCIVLAGRITSCFVNNAGLNEPPARLPNVFALA